MTVADSIAVQLVPADLEDGQIIESVEGTNGTCDGLFTKQVSAA